MRVIIEKVPYENKWKVWEEDPMVGRRYSEMDAEECFSLEEVLVALKKLMIFPISAKNDDPFPTYTNGDRKRNEKQDKKQSEIFAKILKDEDE